MPVALTVSWTAGDLPPVRGRTISKRRALVDIVERGPIPAIYDVRRRRMIALVQYLHYEYAGLLEDTTASRELKKLGNVKLTAQPRYYAQHEHAIDALKKGFVAELAKNRAAFENPFRLV